MHNFYNTTAQTAQILSPPLISSLGSILLSAAIFDGLSVGFNAMAWMQVSFEKMKQCRAFCGFHEIPCNSCLLLCDFCCCSLLLHAIFAVGDFVQSRFFIVGIFRFETRCDSLKFRWLSPFYRLCTENVQNWV